MPKMSGKATISMRGNSNNLPDLFFKKLVQLYVKDCRRRGVEKVTTDGYEYACRKFLENIGEYVRCSELRQEIMDDYPLDLADRVKAQTVNRRKETDKVQFEIDRSTAVYFCFMRSYLICGINF